MQIEVDVKCLDSRIGKEFPYPAYATEGSAALDLVACIDKTLVIPPGKAELIPSGIAIHLKSPEYLAIINPRSGNGHKRGMTLGNGQGWIDSDYQGQIFISLLNRSLTEDVVVNPGDRIVQMAIVPVIRMTPNFVDAFDIETARGEGGFGSTGRQ